MIGITERGDAALDCEWKTWVQNKNPAILITKNPLLLASHLLEVDNFNIIVHATITGYGGTILEPNVVTIDKAIMGIKALKKLLPSEKIVIRIDPIIPTEKGINLAISVLEEINFLGIFRIRISFIDLYPHVLKRFEKENILIEWSSFHTPLATRQNAYLKLQQHSKTVIEVCGEPNFQCTGCVSEMDCAILKVLIDHRKNNHQRPTCACLSLKKELLNNKKPCIHNCLYCYWKKDNEG